MARKKNENLEVAADPQPLCLDEMTMHKLARFAAEMESLQNQVSVQRLLKDNLLIKIDPHGMLAKLDSKIQDLSSKYHVANEKYAKLRGEVGEKLGIDMSKYSYDDETGALHDLGSAS